MRRALAGVSQSDDQPDPLEGGLSIPAWLLLWQECYAPNGMGGLHRTCWPDGQSTLQQPALAPAMFSLINAMLAEERKSNDGR